MDGRPRQILDRDYINSLSSERQHTLLAFRTAIVDELKTLVMLLHTLQPLTEDEILNLELVTDCGLTGKLTLSMDSYGTCADDPDKKATIKSRAELLTRTALAHLIESKGTAMHSFEGAESLEDIEQRIRESIRHRKDVGQGVPQSVEDLLNHIEKIAGERRKTTRKSRPPKQERPTKKPLPIDPEDFGFLK